MNIKNRRGVTLTILVVTIIVMLILFGITFSTSTELLKNTQKNKMKTMLSMVQSRAEILLEDYMFDNENNLSTVTNETIEKSLAGVYITDVNSLKNVGYDETEGGNLASRKDKVIYCTWNESVLKSQGIDTKNLAKGDTIVVQYDIEHNKVDVASQKGFSKNGTAIHALKDFE